jgi:flagellar motor switch protein FliN/FliY
LESNMDEQDLDAAAEGVSPVAEEGGAEDPGSERTPADTTADEMTAEETGAALEDEDPEAAMAAAMAAEMGLAPDGAAMDVVPAMETSAASFEELGDALPGSEPAALSLLYGLDLPVAIELGRTRLSVQDVLALARGSVVQLDRQAGEPVDLFVGDRRFAEAEVVIVGEQFGVRITRILKSHVSAKAKA